MVAIPARYLWGGWVPFSDFTVPAGANLGRAETSPASGSGTTASITSTANTTITRRFVPGSNEAAPIPAANAAASHHGWRDSSYDHTLLQPDGFPSQKDFPCRISGTWTFNLYLSFATGSTAVQYALGSGLTFTFIVYAINASNVSRELFRFTTSAVPGANIGATDATPTLNAFSNNPGTLNLNANEIVQYEVYATFNAGLTPTTVNWRYGGGAPTNNNTNVAGPTIIAVPVKTLTGALTPGPSALTNTYVKYLTGSITPTGALRKQVSKTLTGAVTPTGALTKTLQRTFSGSITPTGALVKTPVKRLTGTLTSAGTLVRTPIKRLTGAVAPTGALAKTVSKTLTGTVAPTGALLKTYVKNVRGYLYGPSGDGSGGTTVIRRWFPKREA